jgi:glycosyltransferase involved in cell wall biosynthesis
VAEPISIIVATYNREDALDAVLRSLSTQTDRGFEVIIADDGSGPPTRAVVDAWLPRLGVRLAHVWHPDQGFRLAEIRNRAILESQGEICIFIDGDCLVRSDFVAVHRRLAEPGWFVAGNRVLLGRQLTERILRQGRQPETWRFPQWFAAWRKRDVNRLLPLIALPLGAVRKLRPRDWRNARGTNLAIRRADLIRVDGFDAAYQGWGREDSDIMVRLIRSGVRCKDGRFASGVLHLWHAENDRSQMPQNDRRLAEIVRENRVHARLGLSTLS